MHLPAPQHSAAPLERADIAERLQWLLRLRWLIVPLFVAVDLASDLLLGREAPWTALAFGGALLALNGLYSALLARGYRVEALLRWARVESAFVVALPVLMVVLDRDPTNPLRYGVLVGVVGAAVVLPRSVEVAVVGIWACSSLIVADALALGLAASRITHAVVARWVMESGVIITVAIIAGYLHQLREQAQGQLRTLRHWSDRA